MRSVPMTEAASPEPKSAYDSLRPFALLAVAAFVLGFLGYVVLGAGETASSRTASAVIAEPVQAGPASDDWNLPKHI